MKLRILLPCLLLVMGVSLVYFSTKSLQNFLAPGLTKRDFTILDSNYLEPNRHIDSTPYEMYEYEKEVLTDDIKSNYFTIPKSIKSAKYQSLCKLGIESHCYSNQIAEVLKYFWVIAPIYSFYQGSVKQMYSLHKDFQGYIESIGLSFCTIEAIREDRGQKYLMTRPGNEPREIQAKFYDDLYLRENFLNVAINKIKEWEYAGWIDAHQIFENTYWWEEAIYNMEKYSSVQIFQLLQKLDKRNETININPGSLYVASVQTELGFKPFPYLGNAFALRKEVYEIMGHIPDECIAGCCDCVFNYGLMDKSINFIYMKKLARL